MKPSKRASSDAPLPIADPYDQRARKIRHAHALSDANIESGRRALGIDDAHGPELISLEHIDLSTRGSARIDPGRT